MSRSAQKLRLEQRDKDLKAFFWKLRNKKEGTIRKYTTEYCVDQASKKFYLAPTTVELIVYNNKENTK